LMISLLVIEIPPWISYQLRLDGICRAYTGRLYIL
jgi:hypothetical protein